MIVSTKKEYNKLDDVKATLYNASDLSTVWERDMPSSYQKSGIQILSYAVNNDGMLSFFFIYMTDFEAKTTGFAVAVLDHENDKSSALNLEIEEGKEAYNMHMKYSENGLLVCAGMFKDVEAKKKKDRVPRNAGVFFYVIDAVNVELKSSGSQSFPREIVQELTYKSIDGLNPGDKYYASSKLEEIDGNYYFLTEHGYNIVGSGTSKVRREVIVSKINGESGQMEWMNLLQKQSMNRSGRYNIVANDGNLYVICLEHPKVVPYQAKGKVYKPGAFPSVSGIGGCNVRVYKVLPDGSVDKYIIHKNDEFSYEPQYQDITFQKDNQLLVYLLRGSKEKFGVLEIE